MNRLRSVALAAVAASLAGCATASTPAPLGRSIAPTPHLPGPASVAPPASRAPVGDPPGERGGTIPAADQHAQDAVGRAAVSQTPAQALRRFAVVYINWNASDIRLRARELAFMSLGAARLAAEQIAASGAGGGLIADRVANRGAVVAIAHGLGRYHGQWVVVTVERTTGSGPYAGLPTATHVTLATVVRVDGGWVVSAWNPAS
jgi:hypothetical protein